MGLKTSEVYRCLEKKTLIFGFEMLDLFAVFLVLAILNFVFSSVKYKALWTWTRLYVSPCSCGSESRESLRIISFTG